MDILDKGKGANILIDGKLAVYANLILHVVGLQLLRLMKMTRLSVRINSPFMSLA